MYVTIGHIVIGDSLHIHSFLNPRVKQLYVIIMFVMSVESTRASRIVIFAAVCERTFFCLFTLFVVSI